MGRKRWTWIGIAAVLTAIITFAWIDGGERETRWIEEPVAMPPAPLCACARRF